jgi:hypothetical protein
MRWLPLLFLCFYASAQQEELTDPGIATDRPGFRDSTRIVPAGMTQFEIGVNVQGNRFQGTRELVGPDTLLRVGILPRWELRASTAGRIDPLRAPLGGVPAGWSDIAIGTKVELLRASGHKPRISLIGMLSLPTGHGEYTSSASDPSTSLVWKENLTEKWGVGGTFGLASVTQEQARYWRRSASVSFTRSLPWQLQSFYETWVVSPHDAGNGNDWSANTGLARSIGRDTQVDVAVGRALRRAPQTWFVTAGFSFRIGKHP